MSRLFTNTTNQLGGGGVLMQVEHERNHHSYQDYHTYVSIANNWMQQYA